MGVRYPRSCSCIYLKNKVKDKAFTFDEMMSDAVCEVTNCHNWIHCRLHGHGLDQHPRWEIMTIKQYHPSKYLCSLTNFERYQFLIHPTVQDFAVYHSVHHLLLIQFLKDIIHFFIQLCTFTTLAFSTLSVRNLRPLFNTNIPPLVGDTASETLLAIGNWFSREEK